MTVEAWVRVGTVSSNVDVSGLIGAMSTSSCLSLWSFGPTLRSDGSLKLMFYYWPRYELRIIGNIVISPNTWTHIAFSAPPNGLIRLFVNGVLDVTIQSVAHTVSNYGFSIGRYCTATFYNGHVSNMRVVRGSTLYTATFPPSTRLCIMS